MPDVVTNAVSGVNTISNGIAVVYVTQAGEQKTLNTYAYEDASLSDIENRLTDRMDNVSYYYTYTG